MLCVWRVCTATHRWARCKDGLKPSPDLEPDTSMDKRANRREDRNSREGRRHGKAVWVAGEKEEEEQHRAQPTAWSGNSLTRQKGCTQQGGQIQLALPQCTLSIRCQGSHAKGPASHADPGSRSSISEIFSGQITREAEMRHKHQASREPHLGLPPLLLCKSWVVWYELARL